MNHLACAKAERVLTVWTVPIEKGADLPDCGMEVPS